jgi:AraC-like DNA-binding protein
MKQVEKGRIAMRAIRLTPGLDLHLADFNPPETVEKKFETRNPVLRFHFYISASGYWDLHSPYRKQRQHRIEHVDQISSLFFYPELEGKMCLPGRRHQSHLSVYITPQLLNTYLGDFDEGLPEDLRDISEGCLDKGFYHRGPLSQMMQTAVDHLQHCPYEGPLQRLYMESKVIELIAHKFAQLCLAGQGSRKAAELPPQDMERIRHARDILCADLENPPKLSELARSAGINHCKLNIGFRQVYGTTVFGYLRQMRLLEAKRLLDSDEMNVTEAALSVGYNSLPSFSRAFLEFFGIPPVQCIKKRFRSFGTQGLRN